MIIRLNKETRAFLAISGLFLVMSFLFLVSAPLTTTRTTDIDDTTAIEILTSEKSEIEATTPITVQTSENAVRAVNLPGETQTSSLGQRLLKTAEGIKVPVFTTPTARHHTKILKVGRGDTLIDMLVNAGANRQDAYYAVKALTKVFNPKRLKVGQKLEVGFQEEPILTSPKIVLISATEAERLEYATSLHGLRIKTDFDSMAVVTSDGNGVFSASKEKIPLKRNHIRARGIINSSLYEGAIEAGIPDGIIVELIRMFSYDIDFQREIRKGDTFEVYYSEIFDPEGNKLKNGVIEYGQMTVRGKDKGFYRFTTPDDKITDYYDEKGRSAKKFLMRTPVDGARISSGFGRRKHPVLGYTKKHSGTDFAAPTGTPIMAAGNGVVERASRWGSYGNYVRIRHANGYKTAYAHLSRYGRGIKAGKRVKQGQIIGYVGATGRVTGPHLHYEVIKNDRKVNPLKIKVPTGRKLNGKILERFKAERTKIGQAMVSATQISNIQTAEAGPAPAEPASNDG